MRAFTASNFVTPGRLQLAAGDGSGFPNALKQLFKEFLLHWSNSASTAFLKAWSSALVRSARSFFQNTVSIRIIEGPSYQSIDHANAAPLPAAFDLPPKFPESSRPRDDSTSTWSVGHVPLKLLVLVGTKEVINSPTERLRLDDLSQTGWYAIGVHTSTSFAGVPAPACGRQKLLSVRTLLVGPGTRSCG